MSFWNVLSYFRKKPPVEFQWKQSNIYSFIPQSEYVQRRTTIMKDKQIPVILFGNNTLMYSPHVKVPFKQNSSFYYLTGINISDCIAILLPTRFSFEYHLFVPKPDPYSPPFDVPKECIVHSVAEFSNFIKKVNPPLVYSNNPPSISNTPHSISQRWKLYTDPIPIKPLLLDEFKVKKSPSEMLAMKSAASINSLIMNQIMSNTYTNEREILADLSNLALQQNAELSFIPTIASGTNTIYPHYTTNNMPIYKKDNLVVDFGVSVDNYCSDMTRSWKFKQSDLYTEIYDKVDLVQKSLISMVNTNTSMDALEQSAKLMLNEAFPFVSINTIFPHNVTHYIGLDLHDTLSISSSKSLQKDSVITIEPGVYFTPSKEVPKEYWGIGIRIEDVVLVTDKEPEILTK
eukprot:NODE_143_length_17796_cov_0.252020.p4 type:complete len:402 gc:universal NODE_143_length_17796_cov_0.252020:14122-12917(-)